jgi:hypothetical protein
VPVRTKSASRREAYVLTLLPLPRVDAVKALRFGLKALKRFGLQCIRIEAGDADPRQTSGRWVIQMALRLRPIVGRFALILIHQSRENIVRADAAR